jgi:tetratricopeptide (TPR) repeat protein
MPQDDSRIGVLVKNTRAVLVSQLTLSVFACGIAGVVLWQLTALAKKQTLAAEQAQVVASKLTEEAQDEANARKKALALQFEALEARNEARAERDEALARAIQAIEERDQAKAQLSLDTERTNTQIQALSNHLNLLNQQLLLVNQASVEATTRQASLLVNKASVEAQQGQTSLALKLYEEALLLDKTNPWIALLKSQLQFETGDHVAAISTLTSTLQALPDFQFGYLELARYYCDLKQYEQARVSFDRALNVNHSPPPSSIEFRLINDDNLFKDCGPLKQSFNRFVTQNKVLANVATNTVQDELTDLITFLRMYGASPLEIRLLPFPITQNGLSIAIDSPVKGALYLIKWRNNEPVFVVPNISGVIDSIFIGRTPIVVPYVYDNASSVLPLRAIVIPEAANNQLFPNGLESLSVSGFVGKVQSFLDVEIPKNPSIASQWGIGVAGGI